MGGNSHAETARKLSKSLWINQIVCILGLIVAGYLIVDHYYPEARSFCDFSIPASSLSNAIEHHHEEEGEEEEEIDFKKPSACAVLNKSPYSYLFGVPVSVFGFLWFVVLTCSSHKLLKTTKKAIENQSHASASQIASELGHFGLANFLWCTQGLFFVFYLIYAEIMVGAICPFCTMIHIFLLILFAISTKQLRHSVTLRRSVGKTTSNSVFSGSHLAEMIWGLKGWLFCIGATFAVPIVGFNM